MVRNVARLNILVFILPLLAFKGIGSHSSIQNSISWCLFPRSFPLKSSRHNVLFSSLYPGASSVPCLLRVFAAYSFIQESIYRCWFSCFWHLQSLNRTVLFTTLFSGFYSSVPCLLRVWIYSFIHLTYCEGLCEAKNRLKPYCKRSRTDRRGIYTRNNEVNSIYGRKEWV